MKSLSSVPLWRGRLRRLWFVARQPRARKASAHLHLVGSLMRLDASGIDNACRRLQAMGVPCERWLVSDWPWEWLWADHTFRATHHLFVRYLAQSWACALRVVVSLNPRGKSAVASRDCLSVLLRHGIPLDGIPLVLGPWVCPEFQRALGESGDHIHRALLPSTIDLANEGAVEVLLDHDRHRRLVAQESDVVDDSAPDSILGRALLSALCWSEENGPEHVATQQAAWRILERVSRHVMRDVLMEPGASGLSAFQVAAASNNPQAIAWVTSCVRAGWLPHPAGQAAWAPWSNLDPNLVAALEAHPGFRWDVPQPDEDPSLQARWAAEETALMATSWGRELARKRQTHRSQTARASLEGVFSSTAPVEDRPRRRF